MVNATARSFNLIDEPWLSCVTREHTRREYSLREILHEADAISDLSCDSPLVKTGLYRLLLALLHSALQGPRTSAEWSSIFQQRHFPIQKIEDYIELWRTRFDLFHPTQPFFQCSNFQLATPRHASQLTPDAPPEGAVEIATHLGGGDAPPLLSFAAAARSLIANQAFALGGGAGTCSARFGKHPNFTHAPLVGQTAVFLKGRTLFETLMLNLLIQRDDRPLGRPAWERESNIRSPGVRACGGYLELLTWQSRCVQLIHEPNGVRLMYYAQGELLDASHSSASSWRPHDPLTLSYLYAGRAQGVRQTIDRTPWRDCGYLFWRRGSDRDQRPAALRQFEELCRSGCFSVAPAIQCELLGMANERAKVLAQTDLALPIPQRLVDDSEASSGLHFGLELCESTGAALSQAMQLLVGLPQHEGLATVQQLYWRTLENPFNELLESLGAQNVQVALSHWAQAVRRAALAAYARGVESTVDANSREFRARVAAENYLSGALVNLGLAS